MMRLFALSLAALPLIGAAPADPLTPQQFKRAMVDTHNAARAEVGAPPVTWDLALVAAAQIWANRLVEKGKLEHDAARGPVGENLAAGTAGAYTPAQLVGFWLAERAHFTNDPLTPASASRSPTFLHYSQVVWRNTTRIGCAMATGGGTDYLVCRYAPAGNVVGQKAF